MTARRGLLVLLLLGPAACSDRKDGGDRGPGAVFRDVTGASGVSFHHRNGAQGNLYMPESMGSGVAILDFDGDGRQDLYFVDSGAVPSPGQPPAKGGNRLYRNLGGLKFEDATARARAEGRGYGMGAVAGDYDNDGDTDLYVTAFGPNTLLRNAGDGTFEDVTAAAGVDDPRWSTGAAFLDYDRDGDLDLFVQNYVDFTTAKHRPCFSGGILVYCTPDQYEATPASLFRNRGDGTFEDVSAAAGVARLAGKGLGVCIDDFDGDGWPEIYCANDTTPNFLLRRTGDGTFEDIGMLSGSALSEDGKEEAGMGVDAADFDGDGRQDLVVTNFTGETNALYRNEGGLFFTEVSRMAGTAAVSLGRLGFGVRWLDYDADGLLDFAVANGHVYPNGEKLSPPVAYAQPPTLWRNAGGGRFEDVTASRGGRDFDVPLVARGLATGDLDGDGDLDLVLTTNGGPPRIFERTGTPEGAWLLVRLEGSRRDRTAIGAVVTVAAGGRRLSLRVRSGGSYLSQSDLGLFFGLGAATRAERIEVRWPDGSIEFLENQPARRILTLREGSVAAAPK